MDRASAWVENPRKYPVPQGVLKPGENNVTVRVFKIAPDGGFKSSGSALKLVLGDGTEIPLAGEWKGRVSADARPPHPLPIAFENWPVMPAVLHNGMIAPVAPLAIKGVIWYQGEANTGRAWQYRRLLPTMIADWRKTFRQGHFPFYIVSLPAFMQRRTTPGEDSWAELRESQALTAKTMPNCGVAVTIDTGDPNDIHPQDKQVVGDRLALCALAGAYGKNVACSGPTLERSYLTNNAIALVFGNTDGGLVFKDGQTPEFSIAGNDRKFHWGDARIDGNTIIVSSRDVTKPKAVRYAWQANPRANLFNGVGLPAGPFRTDDWPGSTADARPY